MNELLTSPRNCPPDHRRLGGRHTAGDPSAREEPFGARAAFGISVWFGLVVGLAELGLTLTLKHLRDPSPLFFRINRHILWTIPIVNLTVFGLCGLLLALLARTRPRRAVRCSTGLLGGLALLALLLAYQALHFWACGFLAVGLASCLTRAIETNLAAFRRLVGRSIAVLAVGVIGLVGLTLGRHVLCEHRAMSALTSPTRGPKAPNVLLVVLDTVRADRMSLYGYGRNTTPNLARLARRGVTFTQARLTAPWTLPSHASMMTGLWPHQQSARLHGPLDGKATTLAQFLAAHGYATAGFVANTTYCSAETGLARGFAHYEDHDLSPLGILCTSALGRRLLWDGLVSAGLWLGHDLRAELRKDAAQINRDLLAWLKTTDKRPFFAFLNYLDAHSPYIPPARFDRHFGLTPESDADRSTLDQWFTLDKAKLGPREIQLASDAYDDCLAYLDEQLGRLFNRVDRSGVLGNTLVIVTADHGEQFGEHDLYCHASSLYDPEIHVPLLVILPAAAHAGAPSPSRSACRIACDHRRDSRLRRHRALPRPVARRLLGSFRASRVRATSRRSRRSRQDRSEPGPFAGLRRSDESPRVRAGHIHSQRRRDRGVVRPRDRSRTARQPGRRAGLHPQARVLPHHLEPDDQRRHAASRMAEHSLHPPP